jgi:pimeloyl-ACP methyl ester carboxylesterase
VIPSRHTAEVEGLHLSWLEAGEGPVVLLLHGWPTSAFLWRDIIPPIAAHSRVIALDLPGFGESAKPLDVSYSFRFYRRVLDAFLASQGVDELGLAVHDLGGPLGLYWAVQQLQRVRKLALLNTLVYPKPSWAVAAFMVAARLPGLRGAMTSPWGLKKAMQIGMHSTPSEAVVAGVQAPFATADARRALLRTVLGLHPKGMAEVAEKLALFEGPVRVIYGERDRILPDVARTMARVKQQLPHAVVTALPDCGHFLQEDAPGPVGEALAEFFAP